MIHDLRSILDGWEYEPGKISVRKIIGRDGREKIQTRVDLGVLQFETNGRPDGLRPNGHDSLLEFFQDRLTDYIAEHGDDDGFTLTPEQCKALRHESHLYYQRYLSLFVLEEYAGVERDTARNLMLMDLCHDYGGNEYDREALEGQRAYVLMMNARAQAYGAMQAKRWCEAIAAVDAGSANVRESLETGDAYEECESVELRVLEELRQEIYGRMPDDQPDKLKWLLTQALEREEYERASQLRDRLAAVPIDES